MSVWWTNQPYTIFHHTTKIERFLFVCLFLFFLKVTLSRCLASAALIFAEFLFLTTLVPKLLDSVDPRQRQIMSKEFNNTGVRTSEK